MKRFNDDPRIPGGEQDRGDVKATPAALGERRLLLAVLDDAIRLIGSASPRSPEYLEACIWMFADDWSHPFTFRNVCDALGLDTGQLRSAVQRDDSGRAFSKHPGLRRVFGSSASEAA